MSRQILHVDINNCYASIECLLNPSLRGKCVAVSGRVEERHGIILAKNEAAKSCGVKTGETIREAKKKCPSLITVPPHYSIYLDYSKRAKRIYERYTDRIESFGIDECWLDVTCARRKLEDISEEIRHTIKHELGITVSIGASFNKIFAKLGSDMKKPDAVTLITEDNFRDKIWKLPAADLLFVGKNCTRKLEVHGIETIGDIAKTPVDSLEGWLGCRGRDLWMYANGLDKTPIDFYWNKPPVKTLSNGTTAYRDLMNNDDVHILTAALSESVAARLRRIGSKAMGVSINVRDSKLRTYTRQCKLRIPTSDGVTVSEYAMKLFQDSYNWDKDTAVRSISVGVYDLCDERSAMQLDFFTNPLILAKRDRINTAMDKIREKYGYTSINRAIVAGDKEFFRFDTRIQNEVHPVGKINS